MTNKKILTRQNRFHGKVVDMATEIIELPNGKQLEMDVVVHPGGAAVVALNDAGHVCLVKQYRGVFDEWLWELPAGKIDHQEPTEVTAERELMEEVGLHAKRWQPLGFMLSSPGVFTEKVALFLAQEFTQHDTAHADDEIIEVHWLPFETALQWCHDGTISDAKSVIGLFRAEKLINANI